MTNDRDLINPYEPPSGASQEPPIDAEFAEKTPLWVAFVEWIFVCSVFFLLLWIGKYLESIDVIPTQDELIIWLRRVLLNR